MRCETASWSGESSTDCRQYVVKRPSIDDRGPPELSVNVRLTAVCLLYTFYCTAPLSCLPFIIIIIIIIINIFNVA